MVADCHLYENRGAGLLLESVNLHQINVTGCHISYNGGGGIVIRRSEVRNIQIGTCDIEANQDPEGPPAANVLFDAREGSIREGAITGCTIQHAHTAPGSANVRFLGRGPADFNKVGNLVIANNALSDVAVNIHLQHARGGHYQREHVLEGVRASPAGGGQLEYPGRAKQHGSQSGLQGRRRAR
jgi:hypothetical protein